MQTPKPHAIAEGIHLCISNAGRFIKSATLLMQEGHFADSYLLTLYALEEIGKVVLVWNASFHTDSEQRWRKWQNRFRDHGEKFWFSKDIDDFSAGAIADPKNKADTQKAKAKEEIAYVEFGGNKFRAPQTISEDDANQILNLATFRLSYLKYNHPSIEQDETKITESLILKGMSEDELRTLMTTRQNSAIEDGTEPESSGGE